MPALTYLYEEFQTAKLEDTAFDDMDGGKLTIPPYNVLRME
jgi:hypothetical protein